MFIQPKSSLGGFAVHTAELKLNFKTTVWTEQQYYHMELSVLQMLRNTEVTKE